MSGYSSSAYGYDAYGYGGYGSYYGGGKGYGYYTQLGPAQFDLRDGAALHLSGPGSTFYSASASGTEYLRENENGSIYGQNYSHSGSYYAVQRSYAHDSNGSTYFVNNERVYDANGLPFSQFYSGQPISATSAYASQHAYTVDSGGYTHGSVTASYSYGYSDGSYRDIYSSRVYGKSYGGSYVPGSVSYYRASSYYDATSGYLSSYHN